jgi:hypothetical protein
VTPREVASLELAPFVGAFDVLAVAADEIDDDQRVGAGIEVGAEAAAHLEARGAGRRRRRERHAEATEREREAGMRLEAHADVTCGGAGRSTPGAQNGSGVPSTRLR